MRHQGQIELCGWDPAALARAEAEIRGLHTALASWELWDPLQLALGDVPDLSVVDARGRTWAEVVGLVNQAHGTRIVLLGTDAPRVGLHIVPDDSRFGEMIDEALHESGFGGDRVLDTLPAPLM